MARGSRSGQAMVIAVLSLGGAILGATALAGLLMLYNIRASADSINSAKAIFAADSGVNWALYSFFNAPEGAQPTLANGSTVSTICYDVNNAATACDSTGATPPTYAISEGLSASSRRAFWLDLTDATTSPP